MPLHELVELYELWLSLRVESLPHLLYPLFLFPRLAFLADPFSLVQNALPPAHFFLDELAVLVGEPLLLFFEDADGCGLALGLEPECLRDLRVEPLFVVDLEVGGGLSAQEPLVFQLAEQVVSEAEQCLLGVLPRDDLLARLPLVLQVQFLLQPAPLCFLQFPPVLGLEPLGDHELCVSLLLVFVEVVLALLPLLLLLQLVHRRHHRAPHQGLNQRPHLQVEVEQVAALDLHSEVEASFARLELGVGRLVDVVVALEFAFVGCLSVFDGGEGIEILLLGVVLVVFIGAVAVLLLGLEGLGDCVEAVLVAGACSFSLTDHDDSYIYEWRKALLKWVNHLPPKTPPSRLLSIILAPCCPIFFFKSSIFLLCSALSRQYRPSTCRIRRG